jgi:putative ribosome biogenesis GTPase RsgA
LNLHDLGWDEGFAASFEPYEDEFEPARVSAQHRGGYDVLAETGERRVRLTGRLRHEAASAAELPAVGDWVALRDQTIHAVLPRRSVFSRKAAWSATEEQVLAANLDAVFVVSALNGDLNLRRLERYLTLAWESGATPVLVLTKPTTSRQLIRLPGGALLVDTPGLREVQLWDADDGIQEAFSDVDELAAGCRFNDCAHLREPGCAVQTAIDEGRLPRERLQSYRQLQRELQRLAMKQDARLRSEARKQRAAFARSLRKASW